MIISRKAVLMTLFAASPAFGCAACGLGAGYTPLMLVISMAFVALPFSFAAFIGWKLWRDSKAKSEAK